MQKGSAMLPGLLADDATGDIMDSSTGGFMVQGKILIGLLQVVTELPSTLRLNFPQAFSDLLSIMRVFLLDIFQIFRIDCLTPLSLHLKTIFIMVIPWVGIALVYLLRCVANSRASRGGVSPELIADRKAENHAKSAYRTFFVIFLLYPLLSRTAFHMMPNSCQVLDEAEIWHMDDLSIDCSSKMHVAFMIFGGVCIIAYPIGIPLIFLLLLWKDERKRQATHPYEVGVSPTRPQTSSFEFLRKDYQVKYYYFETVFLIEKLILTGLLVFVDQGSIFQCFAGACVSFVFFAIQVVTLPYKEWADNILKATAEAQLFLTLLLSIVLRTSDGGALDTDALDADGYGTILVIAFFSAPSVEILIIARKAYQFCRDHKSGNVVNILLPANPAPPGDTEGAVRKSGSSLFGGASLPGDNSK
jgi:NADH:ubiquinone oxidoreductase subunit 3 (subunit A)